MSARAGRSGTRDSGAMKKRILLSCAAMTWFATSAFAVGCDLSAVACPGGAGASSDAGSLDCAGGHSSVLQVTFMPAESAPDLAGIDIVLDMSVGGDIGSEATFWGFWTVNSHRRSVS